MNKMYIYVATMQHRGRGSIKPIGGHRLDTNKTNAKDQIILELTKQYKDYAIVDINMYCLSPFNLIKQLIFYNPEQL